MNTAKTKESREKTYQDLVTKLNEFGICAFLRPTGFGKTWTLARLIKEESYKKIAYFYPAEVIKNTAAEAYANYVESEEENEELAETIREMKEIPNCDMITYTKLARMKEEELDSLKGGFDLIIFDECHRMGGGKTKINAKKLMKANKQAHIVGATATTNRTDAYDVIHDFFKDITVYPYTLHDAFQDELLLRPYYCFCSYDVETDLKEAAFMAGEDINNIRVKEVLKSQMFEINKIAAMDKIIKKVCNKYIRTRYMKFIVFFKNYDNLEEKKSEVRGWFQDAYPNRTIGELTITSKTKEESENVNQLENMVYRKDHIDLIYCIDMLNMGYHVDDITGIVMYRCTNSDIIYTQQLGRVLSSSSNKHAVVFDVVDNLHRKATFTYPAPTRKKNILSIPGGNIDTGISKTKTAGGGDVEFIDFENDNSDIISTGIDIDRETDINNIGKDLDNEDYATIDSNNEGKEPWYNGMNTIEPGDLLATGHEATYKEIIAKAVAESMSMRCREAFECHFKKWCKYNNVPYPISDTELKRIYKLKKEDFVKEFEKIIKKNKINYPMRDAQALLDIGNNNDGFPMEIFAKWKNVSVKAILDLLGVA